MDELLPPATNPDPYFPLIVMKSEAKMHKASARARGGGDGSRRQIVAEPYCEGIYCNILGADFYNSIPDSWYSVLAVPSSTQP